MWKPYWHGTCYLAITEQTILSSTHTEHWKILPLPWPQIKYGYIYFKKYYNSRQLFLKVIWLFCKSLGHQSIHFVEGFCAIGCWLQTCLGDIWHQESHSFPPATPRINQYSSLGRLTLPPHKKNNNNWTISKELKTNTQHRDRVAKSALEKMGRGNELISTQPFSRQSLERQKGWQWVGDKLLPELGQVVVHKAHLLSQWAIKQYCKTEKQTANHHNTLIEGGWLTHHWPLPQRKRARQRNKLPVIKPNSKAGQLMGYRADSGTWGQHTNLSCHTHWGRSWPNSCLWKTELKIKRANKHYPTTWWDYDRASA
jgi:uncharacterized protein YqcC (DUF446 family)